MKLSFENNGTRLQPETPKQFDMATGTAFVDQAFHFFDGDQWDAMLALEQRFDV